MTKLYVISGVSGMTGSETARRLLERGDKVIGFDNFFASDSSLLESIEDDKNFVFYPYDLNNEIQMEYIKKEVLLHKIKHTEIIYINCAAVVHTEYFYDIEATFETNVIGMHKFLTSAIEVGASTFINCSTSEVYSMASWKEGGIEEADYLLLATAEHSQRTSYATGKLMTEFFMKDAVEKGLIRGCSLRFANVYSKYELYAKHIIPHVLTSLAKEQSVTLLENAKMTKRTFLHNFDSCSAIISLVDTSSALDGSAYNVATEEEISMIDLVYLCAKKMKIESPVILFEGERKSDPARRFLSTSKIRQSTSWVPKIKLEYGIELCVDEMKRITAGKQ